MLSLSDQSGRWTFLCYQIGAHRSWTSKQHPPAKWQRVSLVFSILKHLVCFFLVWVLDFNFWCDFNHSPADGESKPCVLGNNVHTSNVSKEKMGVLWLLPFSLYLLICIKSFCHQPTLLRCCVPLTVDRRRPDSLCDYGERAIAGLWIWLEYLFLFVLPVCLPSLFVLCWLCCKLQARRETVYQLWCLKLGASELSSTLILHPLNQHHNCTVIMSTETVQWPHGLHLSLFWAKDIQMFLDCFLTPKLVNVYFVFISMDLYISTRESSFVRINEALITKPCYV